MFQKVTHYYIFVWEIDRTTAFKINFYLYASHYEINVLNLIQWFDEINQIFLNMIGSRIRSRSKPKENKKIIDTIEQYITTLLVPEFLVELPIIIDPETVSVSTLNIKIDDRIQSLAKLSAVIPETLEFIKTIAQVEQDKLVYNE